MIHRREFENKLTKELLKIVHYNLQASVRLSLFSKDVTVDFQFLRKTVPQTCSTDWNRYYRRPYDCLILGNFKFLLLFLVPCNRVFSLTWPASMQIYWNKRKRLHQKKVQLPEDLFGTPTWPPFHCLGTPIWPP